MTVERCKGSPFAKHRPAASAGRTAHWNRIYGTRTAAERSWTQKRPARSLAFVRAARLPAGSLLLDAGCGASTLADHLLRQGRLNLVLVDVSSKALRETRSRLGRRAAGVRWLRADLAADRLALPIDLWHDRAVLHFLTRAPERRRYFENVRRCVRPGGFVVLSGFAPSGPEQCSGLPVRRRSAADLMRELGPQFRLLRRSSERHRTPWGGLQDFVYLLARRRLRPPRSAGPQSVLPDDPPPGPVAPSAPPRSTSQAPS
ncbi:MAG: class I SAM-dependent methyltransferase [Deltaproteobacteria bacterium]|nr:class I SAM-dependent methyltransferase [Deltaproteobacteria bacterium]